MADLPQPQSRSYLTSSDKFEAGTDTPRAFLERCIETTDLFEPHVGAYVAIDLDGARVAADAADTRWRDGAPLSPIDGMPIGIKDIMETANLPTEQGSPLFEGWRGGRDSAAVAALREAGAVIMGKTVTTEFASSHARGTRNPWDLERTPGGSSSGSAAGVGCGMFPAALGTQVIGSILRPASFCGCYGFKPSVGGINRGGSFDGFSQSCSGTLAASLAEAWVVAREIAMRCGGDPGYPGLMGPMALPAATKPKRLALLQTAGWVNATDGAKNALNSAIDQLRQAGIEILDRKSNATIEDAEQAIADARDVSMDINAWEGRWPLNTYARDMDRDGLSKSAQARLTTSETMTQGDYQVLLGRRQEIRDRYAALADEVEACLTLTAPGAAPKGIDWTGDPEFVVPASLLGTPAVTLPVLQDEGLPLGLQLMGFLDRDAELFAHAVAVLTTMSAD